MELRGQSDMLPSNILEAGNMVAEKQPLKVEIAIKYIVPGVHPVRMVKIHTWR
jgi:hypothetical protein